MRVESRVSKERVIPLSLCPGKKIYPCPAVPLSRDKDRIKNPGTNSSVLGRPGTKSLALINKKPGKGRSKTENLVLFFKIFNSFCPGTEKFVPGFLLLSLSRDKGTMGQGIIFVLGQKDNGTFCPRLSRDVPWKP